MIARAPLIESGTSFDGRLVVLGSGTIGLCALALLREVLDFPADRMELVDRLDRREWLRPYLDAGAGFKVRQITRENLGEVLAELAKPGDMLLNLSVGIDSIDLVDWCQQSGVLYVDTALEIWEDLIVDPSSQPPEVRTEYEIQERARNLARTRWRVGGPTAVVTHGANPGLVSHFTKAALLEVAEAMGLAIDPPACRDDWARLAMTTGTKVIHISERDTQVSSLPKQEGEFVNTWSIPGFYEEAMMPFEIGWGTHEKTMAPGALQHAAGPRNAIYAPKAAAHFLLRSWVPLGGQIAGLAIPHNENITISGYLTLVEAGVVKYRPTVAFVYLASDAAMASLHEMMMNDWALPPSERIMNEDIVEGRDELGVLLLGHGATGWWYGSQLDIHGARKLLPGHNPTAIQVAISAVAAVGWAMANPSRGYCEPEDLPHQEILALARPYLEPMASLATDWTPLKGRRGLFDEPSLDRNDPWQFRNFLVG